MNSDDEQTAPMLPQRPLPIEQLAPSAPRWNRDQARHFASIAVQPDIYDPNHSALHKLAAAFLELDSQHTKLADRLDEMKAAPEDLDRLLAQASHQAFRNVYPMTAEAMIRVVKKQVGQ